MQTVVFDPSSKRDGILVVRSVFFREIYQFEARKWRDRERRERGRGRRDGKEKGEINGIKNSLFTVSKSNKRTANVDGGADGDVLTPQEMEFVIECVN